MRNSLGQYRQHPWCAASGMVFTLRMGPRKRGQRRHAGGHVDEAATAFGDPLGRIVDDPRHSTAEPRLVLLGYSVSARLLASCSPSAVTAFASLAPEATRRNATPMKKAPPKRPPPPGAMTSCPSTTSGRGGGSLSADGRRAHRVLEPDVAAGFPMPRPSMTPLRALAGIIRGQRRQGGVTASPPPEIGRGSA